MFSVETCSRLVFPGGPDQRNSAEAVQDCEDGDKHEPRPAVRQQGEDKHNELQMKVEPLTAAASSFLVSWLLCRL